MLTVKLSNPIYFLSKLNLQNRSSIRNKTIILSLSGDHTWLLVVSNPSCGLYFNYIEFKVLLRYMLGFPLYNISRICPSYNKASMDIYGDHCLICGAGSELINRHN